MNMTSDLVKNLVVCTVLLFLGGCAAGPEFQAIPQKGAKRTGVYPRFSDRPKAETGQFTNEEQRSLTRELEGDAQRLRAIPNAPAQSAETAAQRKKDADNEAQETLRQIREGTR